MKINSIKTRAVRPCGYLYVGLDSYYLLYPVPIARDSWQDDHTHRWAVVPIVPDENGIYPYARHVVSSSFSVEYCYDLPTIMILDAGETGNQLETEEKEND